MNNLDLIIQIILMVIGSGFLSYVANLLNKHHKAQHFSRGLVVAEKVARWSVARVATDANLPMGMRRDAVVHELQVVLDKKGYHFNLNRLIGLAQATYNLYKANGHKVIEPEKTPAPKVEKPKPEAPKAPSNQLSNDEINVLNDYRAKKAANK